jgi:hypothetical protein
VGLQNEEAVENAVKLDPPSRNEHSRLLTNESMTQTSSSLKKEVGVAGDVEDGAFVVAAAVDGAFVVPVDTVVEDAVDTIPIIRCGEANCSRFGYWKATKQNSPSLSSNITLT